MFEMARLKVPVISIIIGEGSSGGALAIGVAGILGTHTIFTGGEDTKMKAVKLFAYGIPLAFACIGAYYASAGIKHALVSKDNCTVSVSAVCKSMTTETTATNGRVTSVKYRPTYEYTFDGVKYTAQGGLTQAFRVEGDSYDIFVDPEDPKIINDPEAEKESLAGALLRALFLIGGPLAVMALFIFAFKEAGI